MDSEYHCIVCKLFDSTYSVKSATGVPLKCRRLVHVRGVSDGQTPQRPGKTAMRDQKMWKRKKTCRGAGRSAVSSYYSECVSDSAKGGTGSRRWKRGRGRTACPKSKHAAAQNTFHG